MLLENAKVGKTVEKRIKNRIKELNKTIYPS